MTRLLIYKRAHNSSFDTIKQYDNIICSTTLFLFQSLLFIITVIADIDYYNNVPTRQQYSVIVSTLHRGYCSTMRAKCSKFKCL